MQKTLHMGDARKLKSRKYVGKMWLSSASTEVSQISTPILNALGKTTRTMTKSKIEAEDGPQAEDRKEEEHHWSRRAINEWWHDLVEEKLTKINSENNR